MVVCITYALYYSNSKVSWWYIHIYYNEYILVSDLKVNYSHLLYVMINESENSDL